MIAMNALLVAGMILVSVKPIESHHSLAAVYDTTTTVKLTGMLTAVDWRNPHVEISLDVEEVDGEVQTWTFQGASPGFFLRAGTLDSKEQFIENIGGMVTVEVFPGRNGTPVGGLLKVTFADNMSIISVPCC